MTTLKLASAADLLGCSPQYARQLMREGKIAGEQVGRSWEVDLDSLRQYMSTRGTTRRKPSTGAVSAEVSAPAPAVAEVRPHSAVAAPVAAVDAPAVPGRAETFEEVLADRERLRQALAGMGEVVARMSEVLALTR